MNLTEQKSVFSISSRAPSASKKGTRAAAAAQKKHGDQPLWNGAPTQTFASFLQPLRRTNSSAQQALPNTHLRLLSTPVPAPKQDLHSPLTFSPPPASGSPSAKPLTVAIPPQTAPTNPAAQPSPYALPRHPASPEPAPKQAPRSSFASSPAPAATISQNDRVTATPVTIKARPNGSFFSAQEPLPLRSFSKLAMPSADPRPVLLSAEGAPRNNDKLQHFTLETQDRNRSSGPSFSRQTAPSDNFEFHKLSSDLRFPTTRLSLTPEQNYVALGRQNPNSFFASEFQLRFLDAAPLPSEALSAPILIFDASRPVGFTLIAGTSSSSENPGSSLQNIERNPLPAASALSETGKTGSISESDSAAVRMPVGAAVYSFSASETRESSAANSGAHPPALAFAMPKRGNAARPFASDAVRNIEQNQEQPHAEPTATAADEPDGVDSLNEDLHPSVLGNSGNHSVAGSSSDSSNESQAPTFMEYEGDAPGDYDSDDSASEWISPEGASGSNSRSGSAGGSGGSSGSSSSAGFGTVPFAMKLNRAAKRSAPQKASIRPQAVDSPRRPAGTRSAPRALKLKPIASADPAHRLEPMQTAHLAHRAKSANANSSAEKIIRLQEVRELADKIQARARLLDGSKARLEIKLNPPQLGKISVQLETEGDEMRLVFFADQEETAQALKEARPELAQMLNEQGYHLTRCDIENHLPFRNSPDSHHPAPSEGRSSRDEGHTADDDSEREASSQEENRPLFLGYNTMDVIA